MQSSKAKVAKNMNTLKTSASGGRQPSGTLPDSKDFNSRLSTQRCWPGALTGMRVGGLSVAIPPETVDGDHDPIPLFNAGFHRIQARRSETRTTSSPLFSLPSVSRRFVRVTTAAEESRLYRWADATPLAGVLLAIAGQNSAFARIRCVAAINSRLQFHLKYSRHYTQTERHDGDSG